jgi:hypothetical protein
VDALRYIGVPEATTVANVTQGRPVYGRPDIEWPRAKKQALVRAAWSKKRKATYQRETLRRSQVS